MNATIFRGLVGGARSLMFGALVVLSTTMATFASPIPGLKISETIDPLHFKFEYASSPDKEPVRGFMAFPKGIGPFRTAILNHSPKGHALQMVHNYAPAFLDRGYAIITADLPYAAKPEENDWAEIFRRLSACMEIAAHDERFDAANVYMYGNGPGAMVTMAFAAQTDKLRAVAVTGGGILPKDGVKFEKISAPVLIVHGAKDETVPLELAAQLKSNLERAGKSVEMKVLENSGHEAPMLKTSDVFDPIVAFFNKHAKL